MNKNTNKKNFKTPEDYFEGFTDRLLDRMSNTKKGQEGSLIPKSDGFTLPDGYFETLNKNIQLRLNKEIPKVIALNRKRKTYYFAAAAVAAIVLLTIGIQLNINEDPTFESLAKTEIEDYFDNSDLGFSTYEIAEVIPIDDLEISDILDIHLNDEFIIDYLDESVDDIEELNLTDYEY